MRKILLILAFGISLTLFGNAFKTESKIGYETDYFIPLKPNVDSTDWVKKYAAFNESLLTKEDSINKTKVKVEEDDAFFDAFFNGISICICFYIFSIAMLLTIFIGIGALLLMVAKIIRKYGT